MKKLKKSEEVEKVEETVAEVVAEENHEEMTDISTESLTKAVNIISNTFGISQGYVVTGFKSNGLKATVSLSSADFDVSVTINNLDAF